MKQQRLLALTAACALTLTLAGCAQKKEPEVTPAPVPEGVPQDIVMEVAGLPRDTAVMTVDGEAITAEQILYWITSVADQYAQYGMLDWSAQPEGKSMSEYVRDGAVEIATLHQVLANQAALDGCQPTEEQMAEFETQIQNLKDSTAGQMSGEDDLGYRYWLGYMGVTEEGFRKANLAMYEMENLQKKYFGEDGANITDGDIAQWITDTGVVRVKHILLLASPVTGEDGAVTDDGMAAALERADSIRAELSAAGDTEEKFVELMERYTGDVDQAGAPNSPEGYTYDAQGYVVGTSSRLVDEFTATGRTLAVGEISAPVESSYGYHILLRLEPDHESLREQCVSDKMNDLTEEWMAAAQVETTEAYDTLDAQACYTKLAEVRSGIQTAMQAAMTPETTAPEETGTPTSTETPAPVG